MHFLDKKHDKKKPKNSEEIKKYKSEKLGELIKSVRGDAQSLFYRWEATRLVYRQITSAELTAAIRKAIDAGDINGRSNSQNIGSFLRHIGVFQPDFTVRKGVKTPRKTTTILVK